MILFGISKSVTYKVVKLKVRRASREINVPCLAM
jgi:hypothetical protein